MKDSKVARMRRGAIALRQQCAQRSGGVFSRVLGDAEIASVVSTYVKNYRERIYLPLDTLRLFIGQVLSADRACQDVVGRRLSERVAQGKSASTLNTASYCAARARLPVAIPRALSHKIGERLESSAPRAWRWQGRTVKLFDGTTVSLPDTRATSKRFHRAVSRSPVWASRLRALAH